MTGDEDVLVGFVSAYRRAAQAAAAADAAAQATHRALFDFAGELGGLVRRLVADGNPLGLAVRFVRRPPPHLDDPGGVLVEDAPKDRPPSFAAFVLETPDLWIEVRSDPSRGVEGVTNIPDFEAYAARIVGVAADEDGHPHLLQRLASAGGVGVPEISDAAQLLEAFLVIVAEVYARRTGLDRSAT